ncbi:MAG: CRTAC1 family protein [Acidobacteriota bacterium]
MSGSIERARAAEAGLATLALAGVVILQGLTIGCNPAPPARKGATPPQQRDGGPAQAAAARSEEARVAPFIDITREAGIRFVHNTGGTGRHYLPETMGSGCAFFDYDGDGDPDLYFANGTALPGDGRAPTSGALYRNRGGGTFEEVTLEAALSDPFYGMGVAVGDIDGDGDTDLFVSAVGPDRLYVNRGDGTFEEAGERAGVADPGFGASAAFLDYDLDGDLDLYVSRYVAWSAESDQFCTLDGSTKSFCTPELYRGLADRLYRNRGDGTFEDVTRQAGVERPGGKTLGVAILDANADGWPDVAVANDTSPNYLFLNRGDGTFREVGVQMGIAYSESGSARGGMGIDAADYDQDGMDDILIGNFSKEMAALFRGSRAGRYLDLAAPAGLGLPTLLTLAFGAFFFDHDLDGSLDVLIINGHIEPDIQKVQEIISYAQPPQLFRGTGSGRFEIIEHAGGALSGAYVGRGAAYADIDGDGDLDVAVTQNGRPAMLWRNDTPAGQAWLRVKPVGNRSNRSGLGVILRVHTADGVRTAVVRSGSSYLSASEQVATVGLGRTEQRRAHAELVWPGGAVQDLGEVPLNQRLTVLEGEPPRY